MAAEPANGIIALNPAMRFMAELPWPLKRWIASTPRAWRYYSGICRRVGWKRPRPGWYVAVNGPYRGLRLPVTVANQLWVPTGTYEPRVSELLRQILTDEKWQASGGYVWDIGACHGVISLLCARNGSRVIAFEPMPANRQHFHANLAANPALAGRVEIMAVAVSDRDGEAEFQTGASESEGQLLTNGVKLSHRKPIKPQQFKVRTTTIDSLVASGTPVPRLVKIDIEGAEYLALSGGQKLLRENRPIVVIEVHNRDAAQQCIAWMAEADYSVRKLYRGRLKDLGLTPGLTPLDYGHVVGIPQEHCMASAITG